MWASRFLAGSPAAVGLFIRFLFIGSRLCFHASFRPRLAAQPLRFAITSPPSGCEEDFHLQAIEHARHTSSRAGSEEPALPGEVPRFVSPMAIPAPGTKSRELGMEESRLNWRMNWRLEWNSVLTSCLLTAAWHWTPARILCTWAR